MCTQYEILVSTRMNLFCINYVVWADTRDIETRGFAQKPRILGWISLPCWLLETRAFQSTDRRFSSRESTSQWKHNTKRTGWLRLAVLLCYVDRLPMMREATPVCWFRLCHDRPRSEFLTIHPFGLLCLFIFLRRRSFPLASHFASLLLFVSSHIHM